jgi:hypothetical protein
MPDLLSNEPVPAQVQEEDLSFHMPPKDRSALALVLGDFDKSESWLSSKQWALRWRESQLRYEPIRQVTYWEGTTVPRSSLNVYSVAQVVQSIMAKIMEGLFADSPPFIITPRKGTGAEAARAVESLLSFQIEDCDFRREIEDGAADALLFGTAIWKVNWRETKKTLRTYKRKEQPVTLASPTPGGEPTILHTEESDDIVAEERVIDYGKPCIEMQDLHDTYVDPALRRSDIRKAGFVISRITVSAEQLDEMRGWEGYDIPSESKLMDYLFPRQDSIPVTQMESLQVIGNTATTHQAQPDWMESTVDPTQDTSRFEILERWDNDRVIAILNRKIVIRNEKNPFGKLPYFSVGWWRVPNSFYSMGIGITAGDEQEIQRGLINAMLDEVAWNLNLPILVSKDEELLTQNIRMSLGKFVRVDDPERGVRQMQRLQAVPEGYAEIQASQARVEGSSGANEMLVQGATPSQGRTSMGRTATGANLLAGGSGSRLESFVERLAPQVIIPALDMFFEMDKQLLEMDQLRQILDDEMFDAFDGDHLDVLNAKVKFDVLAASRMVAKQRMAQSLPMMAQTFLTDPMHQMLQAQNKKIDVNELANMWFDISGWKNKASLIVDMTPEEKQQAAMNNPAAQKMQSEQQMLAAKTNAQLQIQDSDNAARAYREVQRQIIQQELKNMAVTGEPNPQMLGGE